MLKKHPWLSAGAVPLMFTVLLVACRRFLWSIDALKWVYLLIFALLLGWNIYSLVRQINNHTLVAQRFIRMIIFLILSVGLTMAFYWMMEQGP